MRLRVRLQVLFVCLLLAPASAFAQASIVGTVRDSSGAVLPGVTVEAASPALIEKVRSAVTDGTGQYRIENLQPGLYTVTFTLAGFSIVRRERIELTGSFVASVNGELRVGALEETITVTGETPIVDVQSTARQRVLTREVLELLPSGRSLAALGGLTVGITGANQDVGGNLGDGVSAGGVRVRGVGDARMLMGGVTANTSYRVLTGAYNLAAYQEVVVDTGGIGAEQEEGGVRINVIPREGGNTFSGTYFFAFANDSMAGKNLTQDLQDRGLRTPDSLKQILDINPGFGGPILRDRIWFHAATRYSRSWNYIPVFFNRNAGDPNVWTYEPDPGRRGSNEGTIKNLTARVTWQATTKHKFAFTYDPSDACECPRALTASVSPEANAANYVITRPNRNLIGQWTAPLTNRLLLESSVVSRNSTAARARSSDGGPTSLPDGGGVVDAVNPYFPPAAVPLIRVQEQSTGLSYRGSPFGRISTNNLLYWRSATSYITGAHAFKVGFIYGRVPNDDYTFTLDSPLEYRFNNGVPNRLTLNATPFREVTDLDADHSVFVQDRWTVRRLTLTGGLRYSFLRIGFPEMEISPGAFTPNRHIVVPETNGATWHDVSPRSSLAFDVFGNGKTALKVSLNQYLGAQDRSTVFGADMSPVGRLITSTTRSWNDGNRNFVPDCDLINPAANGECGAMANTAFGSTQPGRAYDPAATRGWNSRVGNWQFSAGVQHEVLPRMSVDVSYWRTWFYNLSTIDSRALVPEDYDMFSVTAPQDPRLPGGGGYVIPGFFDIKPARFGVPGDEFVTFTNNFGNAYEHWNGVDVTVNARPRPGLLVQGGTSTERRTTDYCDVATKLPETNIGGSTVLNMGTGSTSVGITSVLPASMPLQFCHVQGTFLTQLKLLVAYTVPRIDMQISASVQNLPGAEITAQYVATNAVVAPSLGRNLSGSAPNVTVNLVEPRSMYGDRVNQLDVRFSKILRLGRTRATAGVDVYNALNSSSVLSLNNAFATWQQPLSILPARFAKVVLQLDF
jgi:carboxypeptidase family protein